MFQQPASNQQQPASLPADQQQPALASSQQPETQGIVLHQLVFFMPNVSAASHQPLAASQPASLPAVASSSQQPAASSYQPARRQQPASARYSFTSLFFMHNISAASQQSAAASQPPSLAAAASSLTASSSHPALGIVLHQSFSSTICLILLFLQPSIEPST
jgi:hypothetical protein